MLRFDFSGLGDSEGENEETTLADLFNAIQLGKYVDDTLDALDWLEKNYNKKHFILAGLCGGAITGLHAGVKDGRVIGLIALGMPVILDGHNMDRRLYLTPHQITSNRGSFIRKAANFDAWKRLLLLKSDFKLIYLSFVAPLLKKLQREWKPGSEVSANGRADNLNPTFQPAFLKFIKTGKILFIFGESDKLLWDFREKFMQRFHYTEKSFKHAIEIKIIPDANHIMSFDAWTREMLQTVLHWLRLNGYLAEDTGSYDKASEKWPRALSVK